MAKRLNIMFYSQNTGEQIILPINPNSVEIKYEKNVDKFEILGFGEVNFMGNPSPIRIRFSHFLPEDNSVFNTKSLISYEENQFSKFVEYEYSSKRAVEIFKKWAIEKNKIRVVIDEELNMEAIVLSFSETLRESTSSKPYILEVLEYRNPKIKTIQNLGLIKRTKTLPVPKNIVLKANETVYSVANKYNLDFKKLAKINNIKDVNLKMVGLNLTTTGAL